MEKLEVPTSGADLARILETPLDEGVALAIFTEPVDEITTKEIPFTDKNGEYAHIVLVHTKHWGVRALDVLMPSDEKVKWWKAKNIIHDQKYDTVPIRWEGPISEIPKQYFEKDYVVGIRFYDAGPWFWPKEQPKFTVDDALAAAVDVVAKGDFQW